jgi:hypothetical protein
MTCNGAVHMPPISWQMKGYIMPFLAYRWFCESCAELFDYTPTDRLLGRLGRMGEYTPVRMTRVRGEN